MQNKIALQFSELFFVSFDWNNLDTKPKIAKRYPIINSDVDSVLAIRFPWSVWG